MIIYTDHSALTTLWVGVRIVMFMSFKLESAQQNCSSSERGALAVMRALAEVRWLVLASPWPIREKNEMKEMWWW